MNETMAIEALRATGATAGGFGLPAGAVADPNAVTAFQNAMGSGAVGEPTPIPFVEQIQGAWQAAQVANQSHMHRISVLSEMASQSSSLAGLSELQYRVAETNFQLEITTLVAKKASDAVSTLIKNG